MKRGKSREQIAKEKRELDTLAKCKEEIIQVKKNISEIFSTSEAVSVDTEFKEVTFYVDRAEFDSKQKNFINEGIDLTLIKADSDSIALYFKYKLIRK